MWLFYNSPVNIWKYFVWTSYSHGKTASWIFNHMGKRKRLINNKDGVLYSSLENSLEIFRDAQVFIRQEMKKKTVVWLKQKKSAISCKNHTISCGVRSKQEWTVITCRLYHRKKEKNVLLGFYAFPLFNLMYCSVM